MTNPFTVRMLRKPSAALLSLVLGVCGAIAGEAAYAAPAQRNEILGVRLGMPSQAALQSLKSHQRPFHVINTNSSVIKEVSPKEFVWQADLNDLVDASQMKGLDSVTLEFAMPPTASTVLRISRNSCYNCRNDGKTASDAPSLKGLLQSITEKFGPTPTSVTGRASSGHEIVGETDVYIWTTAGQLLSPEDLRRRLRYPAQCTRAPSLHNFFGGGTVNAPTEYQKNVENGCGTVARVSWQQRGGIVTSFSIELVDVAALVSSLSNTVAAANKRSADMHQQELQRADQNRPTL